MIQPSRPAVPSELFDGCTVSGPVRELLERRTADLLAYQNRRIATQLITLTQQAWTRERTITERTDLSEAVVQNFFKLIAYKDEYEVARMLTDPAFSASVRMQVPGGEKLTYKLHPPVLKALGRKKKIGIGPRGHFTLKLLAKGKCLRGTVFDPFGYMHMRRVERRLITQYETTLHALLGISRPVPTTRRSPSPPPPSLFAATRKSSWNRCVATSRAWMSSESTPRPSRYSDGGFECASKLHEAIAGLSSGRRLGRTGRKVVFPKVQADRATPRVRQGMRGIW